MIIGYDSPSMQPPLVLGIHSGHNAGAALISGGRILSAVSEERLSRQKNITCYPARAIELCLRMGSVQASDLDAVALASRHTFGGTGGGLSHIGVRRLAPLGVSGRALWQARRWAENLRREPEERIPAWVGPWEFTGYDSVASRVRAVVEHLGVAPARVASVDHHRCHATYAMLASPWRTGCLGLVADQVGDYTNASVWTAGDDGRVQRIARCYTLNSLGRIYSVVTALLGMRALEDEHKVMGLAPHATFDHAARHVPLFEPLLRVTGLGFSEPRSAQPCWIALERGLRGARFDHVAGALQMFLEKRMCEWVTAATRHTGLARVVLSGGLALNVKANRVIAQLPGVDQFYVAPGGGDESLAIGAARAISLDLGQDPLAVEALGMPYLGDEFDQASCRLACAALAGDSRFRMVETEDHAGWLASRLARGALVARFDGRMEFGPRALGNRSILADASDRRVADRLNRRVKQRDFWMPFAPAILRERADDYFANPKGIDASVMTVAFRGSTLARREIPAGLHEADGSLRPQVVDERSPGLRDILLRYEALTGRGAMLNTSFNRHREPIVHSPEDAIRTFVDCGLDALDFGCFALERIEPAGND
jgi:carbamoyltransferase